MAAVDYFLKIDSVEGESKDDKHKGEIDVQSWSWGASQAGTFAAGGGGGAGKVSMQDFHFTMHVCKATPKLMKSVATGHHYPKAQLTARKAGGEQQEYLIIKFTDLLVTSYQMGGSSGGDAGLDSVSVNFSKIEFEYKEQKADGSLGPADKFGYDLKAMKPV